MQNKARTTLIASILLPNTTIASSDFNPILLFREQILVGGTIIALVVIASQFLPLEAGYTNFRTRLVFGIGGAAIAIVLVATFYLFVRI